MKALSAWLGMGNRIGRRLIVSMIAFSSMITLVISAIQLFGEYRELRSDLDRQLDQVAIYVPSLSGGVWSFDDAQIKLALDALIRLPNVKRAEIVASDKDDAWSSGQAGSSRTVTRRYSLRHELRGEDAEIATLSIDASLDEIYQRVADHALSIVLSNGLKTVLVAIFMVIVIRRLVTDRLDALARNIGALVPTRLPSEPAAVAEDAQAPAHLDELDAVNWALTHASEKLGVSVDALRCINEELEGRVRERTVALEHANKELEAFGYTLSHDLRSPVRGIAGFGRILQEDYADRLDQPGQQYLSRIVDAAKRMDVLIDDTLGLFKVSALPLTKQKVRLDAIAGEIAEQHAKTEPNRGVGWRIAAGMDAEGDPAMLRIVLENLIGNAWKFTSKRDAAVIEVGCSDGAAKAFFVRDNGAGFDTRYAEKLFMPFQRLHREAEFPGTGVGLATVKKIIERHGGNIWAEAVPDQGACFYFTLHADSATAGQPTSA
jgi:signal transduction histidine kinase